MEGDRFHKVYRFPNDYGASVISSPKGEVERKGSYRIMMIHFDSPAPEHMWTLDDENPIFDAIIDCTDWNMVVECLISLLGLPKRE
jgi:hypothetical protein